MKEKGVNNSVTTDGTMKKKHMLRRPQVKWDKGRKVMVQQKNGTAWSSVKHVGLSLIPSSGTNILGFFNEELPTQQ